jgi:acetate kinase
MTCAHFSFVGVQLDAEKNAAGNSDRDIASPQSTIRVLIVQAQEDWAIARECWNLQKRTKGAA